MHIPARMLRAVIQDYDTGARDLTTREMATRQRILDMSEVVLVKYCAKTITFGALAVALTISTSTLRRHFADIDALLAAIFRRHLEHIARSIGAAPRGAPDLPRARRAAYLAATRTPFGALSPAHVLWVRDRQLLGDDELLPLEDMHNQFGRQLAGERAHHVLAMLDAACFTAAEIEFFLAGAPALCASPPYAPAPEMPVPAPAASQDAGQPDPPEWLKTLRRRQASPHPTGDDLSLISGVAGPAGLSAACLAQPP